MTRRCRCDAAQRMPACFSNAPVAAFARDYISRAYMAHVVRMALASALAKQAMALGLSPEKVARSRGPAIEHSRAAATVQQAGMERNAFGGQNSRHEPDAAKAQAMPERHDGHTASTENDSSGVKQIINGYEQRFEEERLGVREWHKGGHCFWNHAALACMVRAALH